MRTPRMSPRPKEPVLILPEAKTMELIKPYCALFCSVSCFLLRSARVRYGYL